MNLLVTTPLHIFKVNTKTDDISLVRSGDGYYFGLSYWNNSIVLTHSFGCISIHKNGRLPKYSKIHLQQPHQIEWIDNQIVVTNTGKNRLSVYNPDGEFITDIFLNEITKDDKKSRDGNHFNTVHYHEGKLYVVAHNYDRFSEIYILDCSNYKVVDIIRTKANWAHNIWIGECGIVICNSKKGTLEEARTGDTLWSVNLPNIITRGLAVAKDTIIIGGSDYSERKERYWSDGRIWIIDRKSFKTINQLILYGSGEIHDIRIIGYQDGCHNDQVLYEDNIRSISAQLFPISFAYKLRSKYSSLRKDIFPVSQIIRISQLSYRWGSYICSRALPKFR